MKKDSLLFILGTILLGILLCEPLWYDVSAREKEVEVQQTATASVAEKKEVRLLSNMELKMAELISRQKAPLEILELNDEPEESSLLFLATLLDEKGTNYAEKLLKELIRKDATYFTGIYDRMVNGGKEDKKALTNVNFLNGDKKASIAMSNVQQIVSMASVYAEICEITDWHTIRNYAVTLWEQSHSLIENAEMFYCENGVEKWGVETASNSDYAEPEIQEVKCEGHRNLTLIGIICQLDDANGLFSKEIPTEEGWTGWTEELKEKVVALSEQDWNQEYGIVCQVYETKMPLSNAEISSYLAMLPEETSEVRREIIQFALQSVGRVPYYWGGKPSAAGYSKNHFGSPVEPDKNNRTMRGLDCSGWINWVYWSVTGKRLSFEGTVGLSTLGHAISAEEMKPGDVALNTSEDSHIILYLGQDEKGTRYCIHESSQRGTVAVTAIRSDWEFYRNLLD